MINDKNIEEEVIRIINKFGLESNIEYFKNGYTAKLDDLLEKYDLNIAALELLMMEIEEEFGLNCEIYAELKVMGRAHLGVKDIVDVVKRWKNEYT